MHFSRTRKSQFYSLRGSGNEILAWEDLYQSASLYVT